LRSLRLESLEDRYVLSPSVIDPNLGVRTVVSGLVTPTTMAFLGANDFLVLEKNTGKVQHFINGVLANTAVDLPVNSASERGLLGIALSPNFRTDHAVYLRWTQSSTGADSSMLADVPLLGNRVDRFLWDPATATLTLDKNIIQLRAFQDDATNGVMRGNHNGGVIAFGPDNKLYILMGDNGRRGQMQNLPDGPFGPGQPDDQFGGPEPDDAHLTGVVLRLNPDGSAPKDNPFFKVGAKVGGAVGANLQKVFSYGHRNGFGMAFDPVTGMLWESENGDDSFDEINRIDRGSNGGWVQVMGPLSRIAEFKGIETTPRFFGLQQVRWSPDNIADTPKEALRRMFMLPGAKYEDPQFSWRYATPPAGLGFLTSNALGRQYQNDMFVGSAVAGTNPTQALDNGYLMRFQFTANHKNLAFTDPRLKDRVADNFDKNDGHESESLLFGKDFGIVTDIRTGPNGDLFVVSLSDGNVYEIFKKDAAAVLPEKNLVADIPDPPGGAQAVLDASLKNPLGMSFSATAPFRVSDQRTGVSTLYSGDGTRADGTISPVAKVPLTVTIPPAPGRAPGTPTGPVFDGTTDFKLSKGNPARFTFASLDGSIADWNGGTRAELEVTTPGAV